MKRTWLVKVFGENIWRLMMNFIILLAIKRIYFSFHTLETISKRMVNKTSKYKDFRFEIK